MPATSADFEATLSAAGAARRAGDLSRAAALMEAAVAAATAREDVRQLVTAHRGLPHVLTDQGALAEAHAAFQAAVDHARRLGDACLLAHALRHLGRAVAGLGRLPEALAACDEAVLLYRSCTDANPLDVANALRARARVLERACHEADSLLAWREALPLYERAGVQHGVAECRARLG